MGLVTFSERRDRFRFACDANISNLCVYTTAEYDSRESARRESESSGWVIVLEGGLGKNLRSFCPKCMLMIREL